jgi:hypothetical protein
MKKHIHFILLLGITIALPCFSASTATQTLSMSVASSSSITASGNPGALAVNIDMDGNGSATDSSTTYMVTCNTGARGTLKVTGSITSGGDMPENCSLTLNLGSNEGTSQGAQTLSSSSVDLVTGLPTLLCDSSSITYVFSVANGWSVPSQSLSRTVTLTLTSDS